MENKCNDNVIVSVAVSRILKKERYFKTFKNSEMTAHTRSSLKEKSPGDKKQSTKAKIETKDQKNVGTDQIQAPQQPFDIKRCELEDR